jgi:hypothetical protein
MPAPLFFIRSHSPVAPFRIEWHSAVLPVGNPVALQLSRGFDP